MARLLIVEDEPTLAAALAQGLREMGHTCRVAGDGDTAWWELENEAIDLVVLDVMIPGLSGLALCRRLRQMGDTLPVLMLTARDAIDDVVEGLDAGADDYLTKPFAFAELTARIASLLRRVSGQANAGHLRVGALGLDLKSRRAHVDDREAVLTAHEFSLLEFMMRRAGMVVTRTQLMAAGWDDEDVPANVLEVHVSNLRRKLDPTDTRRFIRTMRGVGYRLTEGDA